MNTSEPLSSQTYKPNTLKEYTRHNRTLECKGVWEGVGKDLKTPVIYHVITAPGALLLEAIYL